MPDLEIVGTIQSVEEKHLVRKSDNQPFVLYKFQTFPLGELSSTKRELFNQASALIGHGVALSYTEKVNDSGFTNRYLNKIEITAQPLIPQGAEAPLAPLQATVPQMVQNTPIGRDEAIWRQTATKTAASFNVRDLAEYWQRVAMLMDFYRTGVIPEVESEPELKHVGTFIPPVPGQEALISDEDIPFLYSIY